MKHFFSPMRGALTAALLILLGLAGPAVRAQAPAWQSAAAASGSYSQVTATAANASGGVYIVGYFTGSATFGTTTFTSVGDNDIFVVKWSNGGFVWAQQIGGAGNDFPTGVAVSGTSIYVAGGFESATAAITTVAVGNTMLTQTTRGIPDSFVTKLTDAGSSAAFTWVQQAREVRATDLTVSGSSVYLTGIFSNQTVTLGNTTLTKTSTNPAVDNEFVAKLVDAGSTGSFAWAQLCGGRAYPNRVAANGANVYVVGNFTGGPTTIGNTTITNVAFFDVFVAKLVDAGNTSSYAWVQQAGGTGADQAFAVAVRGNNVYVAGFFNSPTVSFGNTTLTSAGYFDAFIAKLTDAGTSAAFAWALRAGGTDSDAVNGLVVSGSSVYAAGSTGSTSADFGSTILTNAANTDFNRDGFLAKITDAGASAGFTWAKQFGGAGDDVANAIAISGTNLYIAGILAPPASFDSQVVATPTGSRVAFLASLTDPTLLATAAAQSSLPFSLAPNPARASTTVLLPALPGTATATLTLLDALGRAVRTTTVPLPAAGLRREMDLSGLAPGLYALQVRAGTATATRRLVVE